jgi:carbonic anhydrase/acetyltransferase-like protein (isoleucine patch superfamily)
MLYEINGKRPVIGEGTWIAPNASIVGDVRIGKNCFIGFGAVIRGDFGTIVIGDETAVEEGVIIHAAERAQIGNRVIIGHMVMIHGATIEDNSLVGMQSMICDDSIIMEWSIVAEQSLVMRKQVIPSDKVFGGSPAEEIGDLEERHRQGLIMGQQAYIDLTRQYQKNFRLIG